MYSITSFAVQLCGSVPVSSNRIDSGTVSGVKPAWIRLAYSVAPTPCAYALLPPPIVVWLSVARIRSPGSMNFSRATWWQMPGDIASFTE